MATGCTVQGIPGNDGSASQIDQEVIFSFGFKPFLSSLSLRVKDVFDTLSY